MGAAILGESVTTFVSPRVGRGGDLEARAADVARDRRPAGRGPPRLARRAGGRTRAPRTAGPAGAATARASRAARASRWSGPPSRNIAWKAEIPGRGLSSPIVWGDRLFLTTAIEGDVVPGAKAVKHVAEGQEFVHPDATGADRRHTFKLLVARREGRPRPVGAHGVGGHAGRLAAQEGELRLPHRRHRRRAGLRLLRLRGPLRLRLRREARLEVRPRRRGDDGCRRRDLAPPLPRPPDPALRRGQRREVLPRRPRPPHGEGERGGSPARSR